MEKEFSFSNQIGLPEELVPVLVNSQVCEYASIKRDGTPITSPLVPFPGEGGRTIDVNTGLAYTWKAERARRNPKVCLLYSERIGLVGENPPVILVYGQATVHDADLQANTERYAKAIRARNQLFRKLPRFMLRWAVGYIARIWIEITPLKLLWWPSGDTTKDPLKWIAPEGTQVPPSDPKPKPLSASHSPLSDTPTDWHSDMLYALNQLGKPILTVVDEEGYPVPFRVRRGTLHSEGVKLDLLPVMPVKAQGRACLTFHRLEVRNDEMFSNENLSFTGTVDCNGSSALFKTEHQLPGMNFKRGLSDMLSMGDQMLRMKRRLKIEAARRGQPVPVVRLP